tara:strand:- start:1034 stop:1150 length:117 start_codon:yes stop_codon:yes gene_type:complete
MNKEELIKNSLILLVDILEDQGEMEELQVELNKLLEKL